MPWKPSFGEPLPAEPSLDTFRDSVARLAFEDRTVGYLAFRVTHYARHVRGHLWWRQWGPPVEVVEWMQSMTDVPAVGLSNLSDGLIDDPHNEWLAAVRRGEADDFRRDMAPRRYEVVWLTGQERHDAWEEFGFASAR